MKIFACNQLIWVKIDSDRPKTQKKNIVFHGSFEFKTYSEKLKTLTISFGTKITFGQCSDSIDLKKSQNNSCS
jgi:hypothetical protein